ncbi:Flagellar motor protein MotB [Helicobacter sp. NHP19-012]|uniref:Flagellar motor protein MotB n=1 Tax=Helicobacter gastrofelis TaxID=2849642 RepID=A0ABN6IB36_9HELI|nr:MULTISPECIES: flagellar motor protein MotB [unclassified Helicobacter]BCZ19333.1 Flagellar motor protein MotB [Helicobacter sp. NHP19-012]GMB96105.1 Flagellar motor protein MotB [Helicobacter sp. NHP22-001]
MAKKAKKVECPAGERWAVPYADFLSLLLALFIALYAISVINKAKVKALKKEFIKIFDYAPVPDSVQPVIPIPPAPGETQSNEVEEEKESKEHASRSQVTITKVGEGSILEQTDHGAVLKLPSNLRFEDPPYGDVINASMREYIRRIAKIIQLLPDQVQVNVRGYTDNTPLPAASHFKNHYTLAASRAYKVMHALLNDGISPQKLSFASYGKNNPIFPNNSVENRIRNNRVEIYFYTSQHNIEKIRSILDHNMGEINGEGD